VGQLVGLACQGHCQNTIYFDIKFGKKIIPRVAVVQYLLSKCSRNKNASLISPFLVQEKLFLDMFIKRFKDNSDYILRLYEEKNTIIHTPGTKYACHNLNFELF
jgi:hypothetical protein